MAATGQAGWQPALAPPSRSACQRHGLTSHGRTGFISACCTSSPTSECEQLIFCKPGLAHVLTLVCGQCMPWQLLLGMTLGVRLG